MPKRLLWQKWALLLALVVGFAIGAEVVWFLTRPPKPAALWAQIFDHSKPTVIVVADSVFSFLQDLTNKSFTTGEYYNRDYLRFLQSEADAGRVNALLPNLAQRQYTSLADALLVGRILQEYSQFRDRASVKFARHLDQRDLRFNNAVLIGSPRSNPWTALFESQLNFRFEFDLQSHLPAIRNLHPRTGEPSVYSQIEGERPESFALVALVRNLSGAGSVLIIGGTNMEATEAAGEWALTKREVDDSLRQAGIPPEKIVPFEVLLRVRTIAESSHRCQVLGIRRVGGN